MISDPIGSQTSKSIAPILLDNRVADWRMFGIALVLMLVGLTLYLWKFNEFQVGVYMDDAQYAVLAQSIVTGPEYGLTHSPEGVAPTRYPFGWPLLLAPVYALTGGDFQALKAVALALTLANVLVIVIAWQWLGLSGKAVAVATALLYATSPITVSHAGMLMSEPANLLAALASLSLTAWATDRKSSAFANVMMGIAWLFAVYTRSIGVSAVVACAAVLVWRRRWTDLTIASATAVVFASLVAIMSPIRFGDIVNASEYVNQFSNPAGWGRADVADGILSRLWQGTGEYISVHFPEVFVPFSTAPRVQTMLESVGVGWLPTVFGVSAIVFICMGYLGHWRRSGLHPNHVYLPLYLLIVVLWPWRGDRFLYGVLPLLFGYALEGILRLVQAATLHLANKYDAHRVGRTAMLSVAAVATLLFGARLARADSSLVHTRDLRSGTEWVRDHTAPDAVVMADYPEVVHIYAQRATLGLPTSLAHRSSDLPPETYLLLAPILEWRHDGKLVWSEHTERIQAELRAAGIVATRVYANDQQKVEVYRLTNSSEDVDATPTVLKEENP